MARSIARQAAMQLLYERLSGGEADDESLDLVYEQLSMAQPEGSARLRPSKDERQYISDVLTGVEEFETGTIRMEGSSNTMTALKSTAPEHGRSAAYRMWT